MVLIHCHLFNKINIIFNLYDNDNMDILSFIKKPIQLLMKKNQNNKHAKHSVAP